MIVLFTFSPDRKRVVFGSWSARWGSSELFVADAETGEGLPQQAYGFGVYVSGCIASSPDGRRLITSEDDTLHIWDWDADSGSLNKLATWQLNLKNPAPRITISEIPTARFVTYSPEGSQIACTFEHALLIIRSTTGETIRELKPPNDLIDRAHGYECGYSPDGIQIVSHGYFRDTDVLLLWNSETGEILRTFSECFPNAFSPDGRFAVTNSENNINIWNMRTGRELVRWPCAERITDCAFSPDGSFLFSISGSGLKVWSTWDGAELLHYFIGAPLERLSLARGGRSVAIAGGGIRILEMMGFEFGPAIVTPMYLYLSDQNGFDSNPTVRCEWCGQQFVPLPTVLDAIEGISKNANFSETQSPCADLPDEAWEERRLLSECPLCHGSFRFNPFLVDNRERY